jgi:hypothetical protein
MMGITVRMLALFALSVLSWLVMIGIAVAACFTFIPNQSNAGVELVSAIASDYLPPNISHSGAAVQVSNFLSHIAQSPRLWLTGLILARIGIAVARVFLRSILYRPIVIGSPRRYYFLRR